MAAKGLLKLYVTGQTANSQKPIETLKSVLERELKGPYALKIIDVLKYPNLAEEDKILATPTDLQRCVGKPLDIHFLKLSAIAVKIEKSHAGFISC